MNWSKKSKFYSHNFLGNIVVHIHTKYWKDLMTTEGAYFIGKKADRQTDRRTTDASASDKPCWVVYQQRSKKQRSEYVITHHKKNIVHSAK